MSLGGKVAVTVVIVVLAVLAMVGASVQSKDPDRVCAPGLIQVQVGDRTLCTVSA